MYFQVKAHRDHRMCPSVTSKYRDELYLLQPQTTAQILLEMPQRQTHCICYFPPTACDLVTSIHNYL